MASSLDFSAGVLLILQLVVAVVAAYTGYRAVVIRKALYGKLYRNHALGVAFASAALIWLAFANLAPAGSNTSSVTLANILGPVSLALVFIGLFYTVDSTAMVGRFSDPLLRDTFHWSRTRKVLWAINISCVVLTILTPIFFLLFTFFLPIVSGLLLFPALARRTGDLASRRHLAWFSAFYALVFVSTFLFLPLSTSTSGILVTALPLVAAAYCLSRSTRWLAPVNRLQSIRPGAL